MSPTPRASAPPASPPASSPPAPRTSRWSSTTARRHDSATVFTANRCKANPVLWSQEVVKDGTVRAVVLNSGGANCYTGPEGQVRRAVQPFEPHGICLANVEKASRPPSTKTRAAEMNPVIASAPSAVARVARCRIPVQPAAAGIASSGNIGTKKRAGALWPPHHIAKWVTAIRYDAITNDSSRPRRRHSRSFSIIARPVNATASAGAYARRPKR